ncbi:MAG TPA: hypothetical protein VHF69_14380, partial [Candidatus Synoicihabitans sp.]|nr:hypothetical protein [Candidatus Synoicihabitans sp.]
MLISVVPAWQASRTDANESLKEGGAAAGESRRMRRARAALVVLEAALAVTLLAGAGLMVRTFHRLQNVPLGFEPTQKLAVNLQMSREETLSLPERRERYRLLAERIAALPGVRHTALANPVTPQSYYPQKFRLPHQPESGEVEAAAHPVSPEYLTALGAPIRLGR